jgi:peptide/nickel transport system substrate-binding protein
VLKKLIVVVTIYILAFGVLILSGCSSNEQKNEAKAEGQKLDNVDRQELIIAAGGEPEGGFDPTTGWGRYGSPLFQSTLLNVTVT